MSADYQEKARSHSKSYAEAVAPVSTLQKRNYVYEVYSDKIDVGLLSPFSSFGAALL